MGWGLIIQFLVALAVGVVGMLFLAYLFFYKNVESAKQRLEKDAEAARQREAELNQKIRSADLELQQRKKELDLLEKKMRTEMEEQSTKMKEELINKARQEAEDIITKAQNTREQIRREVEKNMEIKIVDYAANITNEVFSSKVKNHLDDVLVDEFIERLKKVDLTKLGSDVKTADVITANPVSEKTLTSIGSIFKEKLSREIKFVSKIDPNVIGGVVLQFETLMLDGGMQSAVRESAAALKQKIEKQYTQ